MPETDDDHWFYDKARGQWIRYDEAERVFVVDQEEKRRELRTRLERIAEECDL